MPLNILSCHHFLQSDIPLHAPTFISFFQIANFFHALPFMTVEEFKSRNAKNQMINRNIKPLYFMLNILISILDLKTPYFFNFFNTPLDV